MTVCQYFLQGRCRFGQNCRFEHSYENDERSNRNTLNSQQLSTIVKKVAEAVILAEKGGQWPLSCFSPLKEGTNIPGWEDYSPEEIRWKMYEARANGTLNQMTQEINQLYKNAEKMRNILKEPTMERVNIIANLIKGKNEPTNISNPFTSLSSSANIFGGSVQSSNTQNIFGAASSSGSQGSIFGGRVNITGNQSNIFGGSSSSAGNIFGNAVCFPNNNIYGSVVSSNVFSPSSLSNSQNSMGNGNIFTSSTISSQNVFSNTSEGNQQNISNAFLCQKNLGVFPIITSNSMLDSKGAENQNQSFNFHTNQNENIFKTQNSNGKSIFSTQPPSSKSAIGSVAQQVPIEFDLSIYSKVENLSEEEIKSFTSATFAFGKIPLKPPSQNFCK